MLFLRERRRNNEMMDMIRTMMEEAAEERRQAARDRRAFLDTLNRLTDAIAQRRVGQ